MPDPPPSLEHLRRAIEREPMRAFEPIVGFAATFLAARYAGAWAAGLVSGAWALIIALSWSRWAGRLDQTALHFSQLSWTDDLTGLGNDRIFRDRLALFVGPAKPSGRVALILFDLDQFKEYNDAFGHPAGDEALRTIASIVRRVATVPMMPSRLGGDEFAILAPDLGTAEAQAVAEEVRRSIESHAWPLRKVTASLGVAAIAAGSAEAVHLQSLADRALYRSKREGGNRVSVHGAADTTGVKSDPG